MGGKSSPPPANTTAQTTTTPWAKAIPFLTGTQGQPGLFPEAAKAFQQYQTLTPERSQLIRDYDPVLRDRYTDIRNFAYGKGNELIQGGYDPTYQAQAGRTAGMGGQGEGWGTPFTAGMERTNGFTAGMGAQGEGYTQAFTAGMGAQGEGYTQAFTAGMGGNGEGWVDPFQVDMTQSRKALGVLDPTRAQQRLLSGQIDNPYLQGMHQSSINTSLRGYDDAIQNLTQSVLPQLGSQAFAAGGYGGSRQGIAEGLALQQAQRNARDLGIEAMGVGNQLYGSAYQSAQDRMSETAQHLSGQAFDVGALNAQQQQQADAANAAAYNQMMQFNAQQQQQASGLNADAFNRFQQFNAQQQQQASGLNADAFNRFQQFNAQQQQSAADVNAAAYNQQQQFNAQQQQQSAAANAAAFNAIQEANAQRLQQADQYAGNLDLQQQAARMANLQAGQGIFQDAFSASDNIFNQLQSIYGAPQQQYLDALNQYASIISPGAGLGGSVSGSGSSQVPVYSSGLGQIFGGAGSIAGLLGSLR